MIFLSYRRDDTAGYSRLIYNSLISIYGSESVFFDVDMRFGIDFVNQINTTLEKTDVLVAVVGRRWLSISDELFPRRIDNPEDYVRIEIESAERNRIPLLPVTVEGAKMPHPKDVPETLKSFVRINAVDISHERYASDIDRLRKVIDDQMLEKRDRDFKERRRREEEENQKRIQEEMADAAQKPDNAEASQQPHVDFPKNAPRLIFVGQHSSRTRHRIRSGMKPRIVTANYHLKYNYSPPRFALFLTIIIMILIIITFLVNNDFI